jgi:GntR family transcriptional regulator
MNSPNDKLLYSIDRGSYEPVYVQLANLLKKHISEGIFQIGDRLPSESQLCNRYAVSPMTVRRAINLLVDEGVASTAQGRGTFVKPLELSAATFNLQGLQEHFSGIAETSVALLDAKVVSANEKTARKLNVQIGQNTIFIRRLISENNNPIFYHREYLVYDPLRPLIEAEMDVTSLQGLFASVENTLLQWGELEITATLLNTEEAQILQTIPSTPAFNIEHLFYDNDSQPISWGWIICGSDTLRFSTKIGICPRE